MMNDVEVGRTPVTVPFTWYGDYDLRFRLEKTTGTGNQTHVERWYLHTHKKTTTPWFEWVGIDLFAQLIPLQFKDEQVWAFAVPEVKEPPDSELIDRAKALKADLDKEKSRVNK